MYSPDEPLFNWNRQTHGHSSARGLEDIAIKFTMRQRFRRFSDWLGLSNAPPSPDQADGDQIKTSLARRLSKKVIPELPRPGTFKRQLSERRERLMPHEPAAVEPRARSVDRRRAVSSPRPPPPPVLPDPPPPPIPAPEALPLREMETDGDPDEKQQVPEVTVMEMADTSGLTAAEDPPPPFSPMSDGEELFPDDATTDVMLEEELDRRWILNLSMHFRDRSDREKFFVTFAETPSRWRRLTISCDYRDAPTDSLERDLKGLRYQREKSARIYEAIRESLSEIEFYDTVTNLKLQTSDGRLHVHVTQDMNEIISYPPASAIKHLRCPQYKESLLKFDSHLSGFVYKVEVDGQVFIKKEIPGPDAVDEFLYEINALHTLRESSSVIRFGGVIVDDEERLVKGLLISFAERGALIDLIYEEKGRLPWKRREKWAMQIVRGLSEIHEAGFVQGDFTLANIVVDAQDDAKIIDINRRGCPIGWEPPEMGPLIENNQKISMFIGVKSDLFQLGMVLWALAMENDEPEVQGRPLVLRAREDVPSYFQKMVMDCLKERPQDRVEAKELLRRWAVEEVEDGVRAQSSHMSFRTCEDQSVDRMVVMPRDENDKSEVIQEAVKPEPEDTIRSADQPSSSSPPPRGRTREIESSPSIGQHRYEEREAYEPAAAASKTSLESSYTHTVVYGEHGEEGDGGRPAQVVSISPPGELNREEDDQGHDNKRWEEVEIEGHPYLIDRAGLESIRAEGDEAADKEKGREEENKTTPATEVSRGSGGDIGESPILVNHEV